MVQANPAAKAAGAGHRVSAPHRHQHERGHVEEGGGAQQTLDAQSPLQARQNRSTEHRSRSEKSEQDAVACRPAPQVLACKQRHQAPKGARPKHEQGEADQRRADGGSVGHVAPSGPHGSHHALRRQDALAGLAAPAVEHHDDAQERNGVQQKNGPGTDGGDHQSAQRRTRGSRHIVAHRVDRDGGAHLGAGNEFRHDRLPNRSGQGVAKAQEKSEGQQDERRGEVKDGQDSQSGCRHEHPALAENEQPAAVHNVRQGPGSK